MFPDLFDVLIVEDDDAQAYLLGRALSGFRPGLRVRRVRSGEESMDLLLSTGARAGMPLQEYPRLIILDVKLPGVSGIDVLRRFKATPALARIPVVMLSVSAETNDVTQSYGLGANSYILKNGGDLKEKVIQIARYWLGTNEPPVLASTSGV